MHVLRVFDTVPLQCTQIVSIPQFDKQSSRIAQYRSRQAAPYWRSRWALMSAWMWSLSRSVLSTSTRKTTWFIGLTPTQLSAICSACAPSTHGHIQDYVTPTGASILVREGWCEPTFDVPGVIPQLDRWF